MNNNQYEILPTTKSNINAYNRYPFTCYEEAVQNLMQKNLKPGEQAVAYYFDENSIIGISAITAFGNLKKAGNIIFKSGQDLDRELEHLHKDVVMHKKVINNMVDTINHANKNWSQIEGRIKKIEQKFDKEHDTLHVQVIDLDNYDLDI